MVEAAVSPAGIRPRLVVVWLSLAGLVAAIVVAAGKYAGALFRGPYAVMFWVGAVTFAGALPPAAEVEKYTGSI